MNTLETATAMRIRWEESGHPAARPEMANAEVHREPPRPEGPTVIALPLRYVLACGGHGL